MSNVKAGNSDPLPTPQTAPLESLIDAVNKLRDPETGCGWHKKQTLATLTSYTQNEVYELSDAIEAGDNAELLSELGDLLFHVVIYAKHAQEKGLFDFDDIARHADEKARRRHPWVFDDTSKTFSGEEWEAIKTQEKQKGSGENGPKGLLDGLPKALPALLGAHEIHKRANSVGFKWKNLHGVLDKIQEELDELREALGENKDLSHIEEEFGDLLFTVAIIGYYTNMNPEKALRGANEKFKRRFKFVEQSMNAAGLPLTPKNRDDMEKFWLDAKKAV